MTTKKSILVAVSLLTICGMLYYFLIYKFDQEYQIRAIVGYLFIETPELNLENGEISEFDFKYFLEFDGANTSIAKIRVERKDETIVYTILEGPNALKGKYIVFEINKQGSEIKASCKGGNIGKGCWPVACG